MVRQNFLFLKKKALPINKELLLSLTHMGGAKSSSMLQRYLRVICNTEP